MKASTVKDPVLPEEAWLLLWVRPRGSRPADEALQAAALRVRSWHRVLAVADQNHLAPLLGSNLRGVARDEVGFPGWFVQELEQRRYACLAHSAQVVFHLAQLLQALHGAAVPAMLLKGALLAETVYADPGARSFNDVDLLVAAQDVPRAHQILKRSGYAPMRPVERSLPPRTGSYLNSNLYHGRGGNRPLIRPLSHLHWHLVNTSLPSDDYVFRIPMAELWAKARSLKLWGAPVLAPERHHLLVQQAEHAYREGFRKLSLLVDLAWVSQADGSRAFWQRTLQVAQDWGLVTQCYNSLFLCRGLGLVEVPPHVLTQLRPAGRRTLAAWILRRTLERPGLQPWGKLVHLANQPGLAGKVRFVMKAVCPPSAELEAIYGRAPGSATAFTYLRWVVHRLGVARRKVWAALVSRPRNTMTFVARATASTSRSDDDAMSVHRGGGATKKSMPSRRHPSG